MKTITLIIFCFLSFSLSNVFAQSFDGPESMVYDVVNDRYLISNNGDGTIQQMANPAAEPTLFVDGLDAPAGLFIMNDQVFVADGSKLMSYSLGDGSLVMDLEIAEANLLNGVTGDGQGSIFVSGTFSKNIFQVDVFYESYQLVADTELRPNGLFYDEQENRVLVVYLASNSPIDAFTVGENVLTTIAETNLSLLDGFTRDHTGTYYLSSAFDNTIYAFSNDFSSYEEFSTGYAGPADMSFDAENGLLLVPNLTGDRVDFVSLFTTGIEELKEAQTFELYPTILGPSNSTIQITTMESVPSANLALYNSLGQQVWKLANTSIVAGNNRFEIPVLANGNYWLNLNVNQEKAQYFPFIYVAY